jgi:signal peptidase I
MSGTMLAALVFGTLFVVSLFCQTLAVYLGARWAKVAVVTRKQAALAAVTLLLASWLTGAAVEWLQAGAFFAMAAQVVVSWIVLAILFRATVPRAAQIWLATLPVSFLAFIATMFIVRPFLFEAFVMPSNSMAPTLLGPHRVGVCTQCGAPAFGSSPETAQHNPADLLAMCSQEMRPVRVPQFNNVSPSRDRFLVCKRFQPRRWDILVFRYPAKPEQLFGMRLVGMPGERIHLAGGSVWINGERVTPPAELRNIEFSPALEWGMPALHGTEGNPAHLGGDEYFVLGDFYLRSMDSRVWSTGAPGHPPYAVPANHVVGVVTTIYWPPSRWRSFR